MRSLLAPPRSRRLTLARTAVGASAVGVLLSSLAMAGVLMGDMVEDFPRHTSHISVGEDYIVYMSVLSRHDTYLGSWTAMDTAPDLVLLTRSDDIDRLLAGAAPQSIIQEWPAAARGHFIFDPPTTDCSGPNGGCLQPSPVLVWMRGDAWVGLNQSAFEHHEVVPYQGGGRSSEWFAPIFISGGTVHTSTLAFIPWWYGALALSAAAGALGGALWIVEARRRRSETTPSFPLPEGGTEQMLGMARLIDLHVQGIERSLRTSGVLILAVGALAMYVTTNPFLDAAYGHAIGYAYPRAPDLLIAAIPYALIMSGIFWFARWSEVRHELRHWRQLLNRLEAEGRRILDG
jgi:hypothetical protein